MHGDDEPLARKIIHELGKTLAFLGAEQVFRRQLDLIEEELGGVGGIET